MIPLFELILNDEGGVDCISLVDRPAMGESWVKLAQIKTQFEAVNKEKRILFGPILIPNKPILRIDDTGNQFYVVFSKETIEQVRNRYHKEKHTSNFNAQHEATIGINGFMVESFIKDSTRGMNAPEKFNHLPDGTWFGSIKVEDDPMWTRFIETGVFTGFSIEGNFKPSMVEDMEILDKFHSFLNEINTILKQ